jgi:hypothetical protein
MPVYQIDIEKTANNVNAQTVFWTNVYHVVAADQAAAVTIGNNIVTIEKTVHAANTTYTKMRVREATTPAPTGSIVTLGGTGGRATPPDVMPMYCVARVDFDKAVGRPCRKYLRIFVGESEQLNGVLTTAAVTSLSTNYGVPLVALGTVCDNTGDLITLSRVITFVQMRQLRRGSKRVTSPVI